MEWSNPDWSYLLGVVHGDGHIAPRSVCICVGYRDAEYAEVLARVLGRMGMAPKIYRKRSALSLEVHSVALAAMFRPLKMRGVWSWPDGLRWPDYIAGVIDTDGCVTTNKSVIITLKRSGNLQRLASELTGIGVRQLHARDTQSVFCGRPYLTEMLTITGMDRMEKLFSAVTLRHPRKRERLASMLENIASIRAHKPMWRRVGEWLHEKGPRTWEEIAQEFRLTKAQTDSVLGSLKRYASLETLPPPKALSRFRVRDL